MDRLKNEFNKQTRERLEYIKNNSENKKARKKATVILLKYDNKSIKEIIDETYLSKRTIINYYYNYLKDGIKFIHSKGNYAKSSLSSIKGFYDEFDERPPQTYKEASERIKKLYNITISESATRRYLNKIDIYTKGSRKTSSNVDTGLNK